MSVIAAARELAALAQFADGLDDLTGIAGFLDVPMGDWFDVPPDQASDYFSRKGLRTTWSYADMLGQEHDRAFTVAKMMDVDMLGQVRDSLQSALANGVTFRDWSATLTPILKQAGWWGEVDGAKLGSPWRLETIFRTNMLTAYAVGQWGQIVSQADIAPYLMYDAVDDHRTRPLHHAWDGKVLPVVHPWWRQHMPPNGHNCFPPEQPVSGRFELGLKAAYSGPMVRISTRHGRTLAVTAKHPVLTPNGWVAAGELREGDCLLAYGGEVELTILGGVEHQQGPTAAHDAFEAIKAKGVAGSRVRSASALDLYGDMEFGDGYIDVVGADRVLTDGRESADDECIQHGAFAATDALGHPLETGLGAPHLLDKAHGPASGGRPGGGALALSGCAIEAGPLDKFLLGSCADANAGANNKGADGISSDADVVGKALDAFPGCVSTDDVIAIDRYEFSGHVYDFQSENGFILASGIITSNCRCGTIQLDADQIADMSLSVSEPPDDGTYRWINPRTGRARDVPNGIDPGFDRNAGADVAQAAERDKIKPGATVPEVAKTLAQRVRQMPAESRAAVSQSMAREHWSRFDALALAFMAGSAEARLAAAVAAYRVRFGDAPPLVPGLSALELVELFQAAVARGVALPPEFDWA